MQEPRHPRENEGRRPDSIEPRLRSRDRHPFNWRVWISTPQCLKILVQKVSPCGERLTLLLDLNGMCEARESEQNRGRSRPDTYTVGVSSGYLVRRPIRVIMETEERMEYFETTPKAARPFRRLERR